MDSDIDKWLEAVSREFGRAPDPQLAAELAEWTGHLAEAQEDDGYLNSWVQAGGDPARRYEDQAMGHELYCYGHLIQAAVAPHRAAGYPDLLAVARRAADHLVATLRPGSTPRPGRASGGRDGTRRALPGDRRVELPRSGPPLRACPSHATLSGHGRGPMYYSDRAPSCSSPSSTAPMP
jgi:DUF1680 family protein